MIVGVVSDTHIPKRAKKLPKVLLESFKNVDLIIHAGDWQTMDVYRELSKLAPVVGVSGNVEDGEVLAFFEKKKIVQLGAFRVGVVHGDGKGKTTLKRAYEAFENEKVDVIIFGHSHIPLLEEHNGVILFNPGSATDKRRQQRYSYGLIQVDSNLKIDHVYYDSKE
ncbi:YfcE family phosphodiesterase [Lottiidibacillus patelloidae]|uniref:Phosphoesterase n=1 Tax=Lottiidibacillus patelloidae TaxID=2670334 RepID=A0A263BWI5_9BACI|nr:metallophosphoesterase family protein [Lottiidibacillus patelloidae]OZM58074.1 YfcE family phosphodiesterase [Lottiidibacillus patelloidae]